MPGISKRGLARCIQLIRCNFRRTEMTPINHCDQSLREMLANRPLARTLQSDAEGAVADRHDERKGAFLTSLVTDHGRPRGWRTQRQTMNSEERGKHLHMLLRWHRLAAVQREACCVCSRNSSQAGLRQRLALCRSSEQHFVGPTLWSFQGRKIQCLTGPSHSAKRISSRTRCNVRAHCRAEVRVQIKDSSGFAMCCDGDGISEAKGRLGE